MNHHKKKTNLKALFGTLSSTLPFTKFFIILSFYITVIQNRCYNKYLYTPNNS